MTTGTTDVVLESSGGSIAPKLLGAFVLLGIAVGLGFLAVEWGFMAGMGAFIFGVAGLSVFAVAFSWSGRGPCTACGKTMDDLPSDISAIRCRHCGAWHSITAKRMSRTPDDHVASFPSYPITIDPGTQPKLGPLCVCCGRPATASAPYEMRKTVVGAPGVGRIVKTWTIQLPVCASHPALTPGTDVTSYEGKLDIKSYAAFRSLAR